MELTKFVERVGLDMSDCYYSLKVAEKQAAQQALHPAPAAVHDPAQVHVLSKFPLLLKFPLLPRFPLLSRFQVLPLLMAPCVIPRTHRQGWLLLRDIIQHLLGLFLVVMTRSTGYAWFIFVVRPAPNDANK